LHCFSLFLSEPDPKPTANPTSVPTAIPTRYQPNYPRDTTRDNRVPTGATNYNSANIPYESDYSRGYGVPTTNVRNPLFPQTRTKPPTPTQSPIPLPTEKPKPTQKPVKPEPEPEPEPEQEPEQEPEPESEPTPLVQTQTEEDILKEAEEEAIAEMTGESPTEEEEEEEEEILEYDDDWRNIYKSGGTSAPIQWTATITWAPTETPPEPVETEGNDEGNVQAELENAEIALSKAQAEVQELEEKVEEITHNSPTASPTKTWSPTTTYAPSDTFSPTDTFNPTNTYGPTETEDRRRLEEETSAEKNSNNATEMFDDEEPLDIEGEKEFQAAVSEVRAMFWRENHRRKLGQRQWQHRRRLHSLMQEAMF